ncbi:MAG TPA: S16 family serine protease [Gaiellaceae bacterium]|nr:S16 family serine protease [Gaiellaceae bacterium]
MKLITPGRLLALGVILFAVALGLYIAPSNEYIFLPDRAHPVAPLVTVQGGHDPLHGGVYFVDIVVRKATILEKLFGGLHDGADLYPASAVNPPGVGDQQRRRIDLQDMHHSQQVAAAVALRAAGKHVVLRSTGALIDGVAAGMPAAGKLEPDDVIVAIDGKRIRSPHDVFTVMSSHKVGDVVAITVRRGKQTLVERMRSVSSGKAQPQHAVVGVVVEPALDIHLPFPVSIDAGNVGGPSAGLAFALEVLAKLGRNVLHGHRIAATGEIFPDGSVGPIGGIRQKTIGARQAGVDAFLVPAGENAIEARKEAHGLRIIPVESFQQALHALATLR